MSLIYAKEKIYRQLCNHLDHENLYGLIPSSQNNSFSNVFSYFIIYFLENDIRNFRNIELIVSKIKNEIYNQIENINFENIRSKKFMQLFCFNCSALYSYDFENNKELIFSGLERIFSYYQNDNFIEYRTLVGDPGTGNFAMFKGVVVSALKFFFNFNKANNLLDEWIDKHLQYMNSNTGLWSRNNYPSLRSIQNSYHQYEIFEFLENYNYVNIDWNIPAESAFMCSDSKGYFSPYSGGSACYDYDSIFFISKNNFLFRKFYEQNKKYNKLIKSIYKYDESLFCELLYKPNILDKLNDIFTSSNPNILMERLKFNILLITKGEILLKPHWCNCENFSIFKPDLWSIWFRYLTVLKISSLDKNLNKENKKGLGFPGIAYKI